MTALRTIALGGSAAVALALASCGGTPPASPRPDAAASPAPTSDAGILDLALEKLSPPDAAAGDRSADTGAAVRSDAAPDQGASFAGCPGPEAYVGNPAWRDTLVIADPFPPLCARWLETNGSLDRNSTVNRLKETLAARAMVTIPPGSYKLIDGAGPAPLALPLCLVGPDRRGQAIGTGTVARRMQGPTSIFDLSFPAPTVGTIRGTLVWEGASPLAVKGLDYLQHCRDTACSPGAISFFVPCQVEGPPTRHVVTLEGGTVELTVTIYRAGIGVGTEPGSFDAASGTFRGVGFDQRDRFKLIYSPEHHHFARNFAVLFDAPIEGACGLEVINLGPTLMSERPVRAWAVDCRLDRQSELKVTAVALR